MAKTIEGIQGNVAVDTGKHDKDATAVLVCRQNNVMHAPVTVHLNPESTDALIAALQAVRAGFPPPQAEATAPATPAAKKAG